jgi:two-component system response regulator/two-component system chemotaxis response regulator CheY
MIQVDCAVLLVEDHADTAEMLQRTLKRHGVAAEVARTAAEALGKIARCAPDCIVMDESMPDMTGLTLFRKLLERTEWKEIPVVFYSASYEWRKQQEAEKLGARAWLVKGVRSVPELVKSVLDICRDE